MNNNKVKVNISISPKIKALAKDKIDMFGGNFSAYVAHLILNDTKSDKQIENVNEGGVQIVGNASNTKISNRIKK